MFAQFRRQRRSGDRPHPADRQSADAAERQSAASSAKDALDLAEKEVHESTPEEINNAGGELAAAVLTDAIGRLIPGVLNDETSALTDSFQDDLLSAPVYTRPEEFRGWKVPEILMSGNHAKIDAWREEQSLLRTKERRPDLLDDKM